jgi:hypothetical protein
MALHKDFPQPQHAILDPSICWSRNKEDPFAIIDILMRSRSTIEFLRLWEKLSNPDSKPIEFERFAIHQMKLLTDTPSMRRLEGKDK